MPALDFWRVESRGGRAGARVWALFRSGDMLLARGLLDRSEDGVFPPLQIALNQVAKKAVEFHAGVARTGQATPAQAACRQTEIAPILLHQHVRRDFRRAKNRVQALVNRECLRNAVFLMVVRVFPAEV